jgi:hypothetical protein
MSLWCLEICMDARDTQIDVMGERRVGRGRREKELLKEEPTRSQNLILYCTPQFLE